MRAQSHQVASHGLSDPVGIAAPAATDCTLPALAPAAASKDIPSQPDRLRGAMMASVLLNVAA
eukprot:1576645-Pleurochrysis_carterae.AAC.1